MEIKEFLLSSRRPEFFLQSFVYQPLNVEEEKLGWLLMVGRIRAESLASLSFLNLLASRIKREYFSNTSFSPQKAFEFALKKGREIFKEYQEKINLASDFDFIALSLLPKKVHFSQIGKISVLILRANKKFEIFDLSQQGEFEKEILFPLMVVKTFEIQENDLIFLGTSNIFSKEKFLKEVKEFPLDDKKLSKLAQSDEEGIALVAKLIPGLPKFSKQEKILEPKKAKKLSFWQNKAKFFSRPKEIFEKIRNFKLKPPKIKLPKFEVFSKKISPWILGTIFLLFFSIFVFSWHQSKTREFFEKTNQIKNLINQAVSIQIYQGKKEAISILNQVLMKINELEKRKLSKREKEVLQELKQKINKIFDGIFPKVEIKDLELIFEMKEPLQKWEADKIQVAQNFIFLGSKNSNLVWRFDQRRKDGIFIPLSIEKVDFLVSFKENPLFLTSDGKLESQVAKATLKLPQKDFKIKSAATFRKNLYLLGENQILKYNLEKIEGEISPQNWLKEALSLKDFFSMAIDGKIYLLSKQKILKLSKGKVEREFELSKIYPKTTQPSKIFTQEGNHYLYIKQNGEILVFDKNGNFIKSLHFPKVKNLIDFWVGKNDKVIYILDGMKIWMGKLP